MTVRAIVFGFALSTFEAARGLFHSEQPKAAIHVLKELECPPYFYVRIDDQVFAVKLRG
jgi:hypothetical protein